jgi:hypothetical protein
MGVYDAIANASCKPLCFISHFVSSGVGQFINFGGLAAGYFLRSMFSKSSAGTGGLVR